MNYKTYSILSQNRSNINVNINLSNISNLFNNILI